MNHAEPGFTVVEAIIAIFFFSFLALAILAGIWIGIRLLNSL